MGTCKIDHSLEDVQNKYTEQRDFLPADLHPSFTDFFQQKHEQSTLNELFHLLKKYDLADKDEQQRRNVQLAQFFEGK